MVFSVPNQFEVALESASREAAKECSPRRKPWVKSGTEQAPKSVREN